MERQVQLLVFGLADRFYALHLSQVQRVVRAVDVTPLPEAPDFVLGVINVHGEIVPLMNTWRRLGVERRDIGVDDEFIIVRGAGRTIALAVDRVKDVVRRPQEDLIASDRFLDQPHRIEGAMQLEDGLVLIHDLDRFLSDEEAREIDAVLSKQAPHG